MNIILFIHILSCLPLYVNTGWVRVFLPGFSVGHFHLKWLRLALLNLFYIVVQSHIEDRLGERSQTETYGGSYERNRG